MIPEIGQKSPPPFCHGPSSCHTGRIPMVPILQIPYSDSSYPNIFYRLPTFSTFQNTHIYRTTGLRISGAYGRPIGSPTTIHTNIPAITVTLLAKEL